MSVVAFKTSSLLSVSFAHPAPALPQYSGLTHADDQHAARWLAHLLRLGLLPTGYMYPKADRAVRDVLRTRSQLVRQKTMVVLSLHSLLTWLTGSRLSLPRLRPLTLDVVHTLVPVPEQVQSVMSSLTVRQCLEQQIHDIAHVVRPASRVQPGDALRQTVNGIGPILALTILLKPVTCGDSRRWGPSPPLVGASAASI